MEFLRTIGKAMGSALGYLIGAMLLIFGFVGINWIGSKTLWPFLIFVLESLTTESTHLTFVAKTSILFVMLVAALLMTTAKEFSRLYGWGEISVGAFLAWKTMSTTFSSDTKQNVLLLLASLVILEKGIARVGEGMEKARLEKRKARKQGSDGQVAATAMEAQPDEGIAS